MDFLGLNELSHDVGPATFVAYAALAVEKNNRLHDYQLERLADSRCTPTNFQPSSTPLIPSLPQSPSQNTYTPMDIDATRRRTLSLTPDERQRRFAENLCLYCGQAGHAFLTFPSRKPKNTTPTAWQTGLELGRTRTEPDRKT